MRVFWFADAFGMACAVLALMLAVLAAPDPAQADPGDAPLGTTATTDEHGAAVRHGDHGGAFDPSCHRDRDCSPSAIVAGGRDRRADLPPFANQHKTTIRYQATHPNMKEDA